MTKSRLPESRAYTNVHFKRYLRLSILSSISNRKSFQKMYKSKIIQEDCISHSTMLSPFRHNMGLGLNLFVMFLTNIHSMLLRDLDFVKVRAVYSAEFTANFSTLCATSNLKAAIETLIFLFFPSYKFSYFSLKGKPGN